MIVLGAPQRIIAESQKHWIASEPLGVDIVPDASMPLCVRHQIRPFDGSGGWFYKGWKAEVYDRHKNVCEASLMDRDFTSVSVPFDQGEIDDQDMESISGEVVYGGLIFHHFGHFLLESTSRLWWPLDSGFKGKIVFQNTRRATPLPDFILRFFELVGISDRVIVATNTLHLEKVIVPHRSFTIRKSLHRAFLTPFLIAGDAVEESFPDATRAASSGVYLSRTRFPIRRSFGEKRIENAFARNDFEIVYMEDLSLDEQIMTMKRHRTVAGVAGSAFHSMLFCRDSKNAVYICKDYDINQNFFMIDELMGNNSTYIYNGPPDAAERARTDRRLISSSYREDAFLDVEKIRWYLREEGIFRSRR